MALTMNEESKQKELKKLLCENEKYLASTWGNIVSSTPKLLSYAVAADRRPKIGSSNIYCYVGLTKASLNIVTFSGCDKSNRIFSYTIAGYSECSSEKGCIKKQCDSEL